LRQRLIWNNRDIRGEALWNEQEKKKEGMDLPPEDDDEMERREKIKVE